MNKPKEREKWSSLQQQISIEQMKARQRAVENINKSILGMSDCRRKMQELEPGSKEYETILEKYRNYQAMKVNAEFTLNGGFPGKCA